LNCSFAILNRTYSNRVILYKEFQNYNKLEKKMAQPRTSLITHVSNAGQEQIQIIVHSGINLPASGFNDSVKSYVTWYEILINL
jgi:hypothetical protein